MERSRIVSGAVSVALLSAACGGVAEAPRQDAGRDEPAVELAGSLSSEEAADAAEGVNAFGFELHRAVAEPEENTVTSPLSASALLAMVAAGAGGSTAEEMVEVLRLEGPRDDRFAALLADLTDQSDVTLSIANSLWAAEGYPFEDEYLTFVQDTFGASLDEVDLGAPETADRIDDWVDEQTEGLIEDIADDLELPDPQAVLVLLNAVHFLGTWTTTFDEDDTRDAPFQLADGTEVEVPTMHRSDPELDTATGDGFTMARLPYGDDERFGMEVDRPFAFTVSDRQTGTILFLGSVHDPRS